MRAALPLVVAGLCWGAALAGVGLSGCGSSPYAPVEGTVKYRNQPLDHGRIIFYPEKGGRPAYGEIQNGQFRLTTLSPGDGALIGKHRVAVHCDRAAKPNDAFSDRISLIPKRYTSPDSSGLVVEVKPGPNEFHFTLTD